MIVKYLKKIASAVLDILQLIKIRYFVNKNMEQIANFFQVTLKKINISRNIYFSCMTTYTFDIFFDEY